MNPSIRDNSRFTLALALAALVVVVGATSFHRKVQTFHDPGVLLGTEGSTVVVTDASGRSPLMAGDQILLVNSQTIGTPLQALNALREAPRSEVVVLRSEALRTIDFTRPPLRIDATYLVQALIGLLYLFIGLYTLLKDDSRQSTLFFFWTLVSSMFYMFVSTPVHLLTLDGIGKGVYLLEEVARLLLPPLTLHLLLSLGFDRRRSRLRTATPFFYLPAAGLLVLQADLIFNQGRFLAGPPRPGIVRTLDRLELYLVVLFSLSAAIVLVAQLLRQRRPERRRQFLWIALGVVFGYLPFLVLYLVPWSFGLRGPRLLELLAVAPLAIVPLTFAYAILRYRLWDITIIAREAATYSLTLIVGVLAYSLFDQVVSSEIPAGSGALRGAVSLVGVLLVGGLLIPTRQGIGNALERLYYRGSFSKRRALENLGKELLYERNLESLGRVLLEQLIEALDLQQANLYLREGERLLPLHADEEFVQTIDVEDLDGDFWRADSVTLSGVSLPSNGDHPATQQLFVSGYRYAFPLTVRGRKVGALVTTYPLGDTPLSSEDRHLVRQLLNQAALAIENAHLLDRLGQQLREVQALRQYNESIVEASPAAIVVVDSANRVRSCNGAFSRLTGAGRTQIENRRLEEILPEIPIPEPDGHFEEVEYENRDGEDLTLQVHSAPFAGQGGESLRLVLLSDISERVAMERALREKDRLAALGVMAAGIAHEVNTPLTGISSYAQMLLNETNSEDSRYELLRKVERQTFRASRIVNTLLNLARRKDVEELQDVDLHQLIVESADLLRERFARSGTRFELAEDEAPAIVLGNEVELQQVFTNLFLNASDAMSRQGGGRLRVEVGTENGSVEVRVSDDGPGVPETRRKRIFEPFYSTKQDQGGTGLGLSISYEIVSHHHGELQLEENEGGEAGTCFVVRLPRREDGPARATKHANHEPGVDPQTGGTRRPEQRS